MTTRYDLDMIETGHQASLVNHMSIDIGGAVIGRATRAVLILSGAVNAPAAPASSEPPLGRKQTR
jgi:hypothetical protein